jgi:hypothetical protein
MRVRQWIRSQVCPAEELSDDMTRAEPAAPAIRPVATVSCVWTVGCAVRAFREWPA